MKSKKGLLITTIVMAIVLGILAIGDWDYTISQAIINKESLFGELFNLFGEIPATLGILLGVTLLFGGRKKEVAWSNIVGILISLPVMALFSFSVCYMPVRYFYEHAEDGIPQGAMVGIILFAALLFGSLLLLIKKMGNEKLRGYRKHGLVLLLLMITEMVLVNVLKIIWARPRMRSMESIDQFKRWYEINGPLNSEEFKSFPSGHTANGFAMIAYTIFIPVNKAKQLKVMTAIAIVWGVCTALSRVVLGAHFLSDVAVGGYITMVIFYLLSGWLLGKSDQL